MSAYSPAVLVALVAQPVVSEHLRVKIMALERRVVNVRDWSLKEEKRVMVDVGRAAIEVKECDNVLAGRGVKVDLERCKVGMTHYKVQMKK